jgi:hypothetical protein
MNVYPNTLHNTVDTFTPPTVLPTTPQENTMNATPTPTIPAPNPVNLVTENKLFLLLTQLQETIGGIKHELLGLGHLLAQAQQPTPTPAPTPPNAQADLVQAVEMVLKEGAWFEEKIQEEVESHMDDIKPSIEEEVLSCVEAFMSNSFDIRDFISIRDEVNDELSDVLDGLVETAVDDALDNLLEDKITEVLTNKTITINL